MGKMTATERKYVIVSRLSLRRYFQMRSELVSGIYFERVEESFVIKWTANILNAKYFDSEDEAWEFAEDMWGRTFTTDMMGIMSFRTDYLSAKLAKNNEPNVDGEGVPLCFNYDGSSFHEVVRNH